MKIPCHMIQDLLPNYIDGCTSEKTNQDIQDHLAQCSACHKLYEEMKKPLPIKENHDIDYLKHIKKKQLLKIIGSIGICCLIFITINFLKSYVIGYNTTIMNINQLSVENENIIIDVSSISQDEALVNYKYEIDENNKQILSLQAVKTSFLHSAHQTQFQIPLSEINNYLIINDKIISHEGKIYDRDIVDMVDNSITYVGNAPGVGNLLGIMNMQEEGDYHISLQTSKEPYSIHIIFNSTLSPLKKERVIKKCQMVLASIDNCNIIYIESNDNSEKVTYTKKIRNYDDMQALKDS